MNQQLFTLIQITYTVALPIFIAYVSNRVKKHENSSDNGKRADMLILRLCLMDMHDKYMVQGYISREGFKTFEEIWDLYHNGYGGNLLTDRFHDDIKNLPIN